MSTVDRICDGGLCRWATALPQLSASCQVPFARSCGGSAVMPKMPPGQTTKFFNDVIRIRGKFNVGETKQDGYLVSLYVLTVERIDGQ